MELDLRSAGWMNSWVSFCFSLRSAVEGIVDESVSVLGGEVGTGVLGFERGPFPAYLFFLGCWDGDGTAYIA